MSPALVAWSNYAMVRQVPELAEVVETYGAERTYRAACASLDHPMTWGLTPDQVGSIIEVLEKEK